MATERNKIIKQIKGLVSKLGGHVPISSAYLFGSYAKGNPKSWSDIDIALVSPSFKGIRFLDFKMLLPYLREYSNRIEIHPFRKGDFNPKQNLFVKEIIKTGIKI